MEKLSFKAGGGLVYKTPSIFTEEVERLQFQNVGPININNTSAERSLGFNEDGNYKWFITNDLNFSSNLMLPIAQSKYLLNLFSVNNFCLTSV